MQVLKNGVIQIDCMHTISNAVPSKNLFPTHPSITIAEVRNTVKAYFLNSFIFFKPFMQSLPEIFIKSIVIF
jgi:hypothetical protein